MAELNVLSKENIRIQTIRWTEFSFYFVKLGRTELYIQATLDYVRRYADKRQVFPYEYEIIAVNQNNKPILVLFKYAGATLQAKAIFLLAYTCLSSDLYDYLDKELELTKIKANEILIQGYDCWYEQDYLPDNLIIDSALLHRQTSLMASRSGNNKQNLSRLPNNLTIKGNFSPIVTIKKIPDNLRVEGSLNLVGLKSTEIGENLVVTDELTIANTPVNHRLTCHTLSLVARTTDLDMTLIDGLEDLNIDNSKVPDNINIPGICVILNDPSVETKIRNITAHTISLTASVQKLTNLSCDTLDLEVKSLTAVPEVKVKSLRLSNCPDLQNFDRLSVEEDMRVWGCPKLQLPEYGIVYGNMYLDTTLPIPKTFCCLGQIKVEQ